MERKRKRWREMERERERVEKRRWVTKVKRRREGIIQREKERS